MERSAAACTAGLAGGAGSVDSGEGGGGGGGGGGGEEKVTAAADAPPTVAGRRNAATAAADVPAAEEAATPPLTLLAAAAAAPAPAAVAIRRAGALGAANACGRSAAVLRGSSAERVRVSRRGDGVRSCDGFVGDELTVECRRVRNGGNAPCGTRPLVSTAASSLHRSASRSRTSTLRMSFPGTTRS
jgi:hypothetical protein